MRTRVHDSRFTTETKGGSRIKPSNPVPVVDLKGRHVTLIKPRGRKTEERGDSGG